MKKIIIFIIILVSIGVVSAQKTSTPSYSIVSRVDTPTINRGDIFEFEVYVSGFGKIVSNKLFMTSPKEMLDRPSPNNFINNIAVLDGKCEFVEPEVHDFDGTVGWIGISSCVFENVVQEINPLHIPRIGGESWDEENAPILFVLNTKKYQWYNPSTYYPTGDKEISLVLTYSDGENWYTTAHSVPFHINNFWEQHDTLYNFFIVISGAIAIAFASFIWHKVEERIIESNDAPKQKHNSKKRSRRSKR